MGVRAVQSRYAERNAANMRNEAMLTMRERQREQLAPRADSVP